MKTTVKKIAAALAISLALLTLLSMESLGQNEIVRETREMPPIDQIDVGGAFEVVLTFGEAQKVEVETRQKSLEKIETRVKDGLFTVTASNLRNEKTQRLYLSVPGLNSIRAHGAATLKGTNTLETDMLTIEASGAADVNLDLNVKTLSTQSSGASDIELSGMAENHSAVVSGAATLDAKQMVAQFTDASVSGAGTAKVNSAQLTGNTSGAGEIYNTAPVEDPDGREVIIVTKSKDSDTTYVKVPGKRVSVTVSEDEDTVKIRLGNRTWVIDEDGNVATSRCEKPRFNGHWAGVDLGFNGYVNPDFNMSFPREQEYLDLRMEKSLVVNLNFFEQNIPLTKSQKFGMLTGLGFTFNNYRFMRPTRLTMDSSALVGFLDQDISIKKSKLTAMYLTLPVLFEFQTAPCYHKNGFHFSAGVIVGARLTSHTKKYYNELNKEFDVTLYNPQADRYEVVYTAVSPNDPKAHAYGDWFLQPFKFDATARIGWNFLNFWATYSLNTMFRKDKGPELYPWSAGITLVCF